MSPSIFTRNTKSGFTVVEILIVITVIGILAVLVLNTVNGTQVRAKNTRVTNDIAVLEKAILAARNESGKTLREITGKDCTSCACPYAAGDTTAYNSLAKTDVCWTDYSDSLDAIAVAARTNLDELKQGDPWGSPYAIDENEGEQPADPCTQDTIMSFGSSSNANGATSVGTRSIRNSLSQC